MNVVDFYSGSGGIFGDYFSGGYFSGHPVEVDKKLTG